LNVVWRPGKRSLRSRVFSLTLTGLLFLLIVMVSSGEYGVRQSQKQTFRERLTLGKSIGSQIDSLLLQNLSFLQNASFSPGWDPEDNNPEPELSALHTARLYGFFSEVRLLQPQPSLEKPTVSNLVLHDGKQMILFQVPLRNGTIIGEVDPADHFLNKVLQTGTTGKTGSVEVADANDAVLASTEAQDLFRKSHHSDCVEELFRTVDGSIRRCESGKVTRIVTTIALKSAPWKLNLAQSEDEALAPVHQMRTRFFLAGIIVFGIAILVLWGMTSSIIEPIRALTVSARKISSGDLSEPVPIRGEEEIGILGNTMEEMRVKLGRLIEEVDNANRTLEKRVEMRTGEVNKLYNELKQKEEIRRSLLRKVISAQEDERKRIARELHDDLSQTLATLLLKLNGANEEAKDMAVRAIDNIQRLILDLRPAVLDDLGLSVAIRWYAENRLEPLGIHVYFEGNAAEIIRGTDMEIALFRIAQEALNNIAKHAKAENVMVSLEEKDGVVQLEIEDDGKGFEPETFTAVRNGHGFGLHGMRERVELLQGQLEIESAPDSGTRIIVTIPVSQGMPAYG
jgi:signal transduction histidine kinase